MSRFDEERRQVLASVAAVAGWNGSEVAAEPAISVLASPSWRGVDGTPWRVRRKASGETLLIKVMDPDLAFYIDVPTAFLAARRASDLGIGPRLLAADEAAGVLVMEDLDQGWRVGTLERMRDPKIVDAVIRGAARLPVRRAAAQIRWRIRRDRALPRRRQGDERAVADRRRLVDRRATLRRRHVEGNHHWACADSWRRQCLELPRSATPARFG